MLGKVTEVFKRFGKELDLREAVGQLDACDITAHVTKFDSSCFPESLRAEMTVPQGKIVLRQDGGDPHHPYRVMRSGHLEAPDGTTTTFSSREAGNLLALVKRALHAPAPNAETVRS